MNGSHRARSSPSFGKWPRLGAGGKEKGISTGGKEKGISTESEIETLE
jgi:hypothetical protein